MKAQLLVDELIWPDDFEKTQIQASSLKALGKYYDTSSSRIVPKSCHKLVPFEVRVFAFGWTIVDLARSLGKEPP